VHTPLLPVANEFGYNEGHDNTKVAPVSCGDCGLEANGKQNVVDWDTSKHEEQNVLDESNECHVEEEEDEPGNLALDNFPVQL
jgi:hypothetical protein